MLRSGAMGDVVSGAARFRFPAARRLKRSRDFDRVRLEGRTLRGRLLTLGVFEVEEESAFRVGFVTSRRIGAAAVRNRVRRRLRDIVRRDQHGLRKGIWLVVIARPGAAAAEFGALEKEWRRLAERAAVLPPSSS
ncbi:MAG TPA: ribonuclease P protein component [Chthoniobacterales bacterium]|jgi:ribonuclease P protein component|nr:ribonuclease P protein component [Chthoniobacterales bacterium]